ncbi:MAG TPA: nuclear transport factor 2 family protein [Chondromyces sp.]|nr:nuclear transport factor 2 family protein [Chondromyces sp.]
MSDGIRERVEKLNAMVLQGKIMEAMNEFYADDVVMAENDNPPTVGLAANLEREQAFVDNTTWYGAEVKNVVVDGDTSMVQWWLDFHNVQYGARLAFTQVAVQRWRDDKIVDERFYYSPQPVDES